MSADDPTQPPFQVGYGPNDPTAVPAAQQATGNDPWDLSGILQAIGMVQLNYGNPMPRLDPTVPSWIGLDKKGNPAIDQSFWYSGPDNTPGHFLDDRVYMGHETTENVPQSRIALPGEPFAAGGPSTQHNTTTVQAALNQPYTWDENRVMDVEKRMREAGLKVESFDDLMKVWRGLVIRASRTYVLSSGKNAVTPWDLLAQTKKENIANGTLDKNGNIVRTNTHTSVFSVDDGTAWQTMKAATAQLLGRDPSDQEVRDFVSRASNVAANHPTTTTTTSTTNAETGNSTTSSSTDSGFNEADLNHMAYQEMQADPEYGAYQAAGTYFNAMLSALNEVAPGAVGG